MAIRLISGPANAGKAQVAIEAVRAHLARDEQPLLVVPTRADVEHYRRELAGDGALMGGGVLGFAGLVDQVVERAGAREPVLGPVARERLLATAARRALANESPRAVARLADAAQAFVAELRLRRISPARLQEALSRWSAAGAPAHALGELYRGYDDMLRALGCIDPEQRAIAALDALRRRPASWGRTPVVVYGFDDLDLLQLDVIETLGVLVDAALTVSLTFEPGRIAFAGRAATYQALAPLAGEHVQLPALVTHYAPGAREALAHLERSVFEDSPGRVGAGGAIRLLEGAGERSELHLVAGEIRGLLDGGMAAEEIAIVLRVDGPGADVVEDVLGAHGIPYALERHRAFGDSATGRALAGLLRSAGPRGELADLLSFLRAPGLLARQELADDLEAGARRSGVLSAAGARELWEERHWTLDAIDRVQDAAGRGPSALIERARRELLWLFCRPRAKVGAPLAGDELDEASALAAGTLALGELAELARRSRALAPADPLELAQALEPLALFSGDAPGRGAVAVLDPLALRARRVRALFLCRMQEGLFPRAARATSLLAEEDRRSLAEVSGLRLGAREDALAAERYLFYATVSRAEELLVLSWHVCDDDGAPRARSLFVDDLCDVFDERLTPERPSQPGAAVSATATDDDRPAARPPGSGAPSGDLPEHLLDGQVLESLSLARPVWSASSLETWISCPVRWFVERGLRARDLEAEPEPLARGALAHAALKDVFEGLRAAVGSARVTGETEMLARRLLAEALELREADHPLSVAPERAAGVRRRLAADLERYLRHAASSADELAEGGALPEPRYFELGFGFEGERDGGGEDDGEGEGGELPALDLGDGLALRGRIDRVDVGQDGGAIVYDYKGASVCPGAKWETEGVLQAALYMTAVQRLLGLTTVGGLYQPLAGRDLRPRGALDRSRSGVVKGYSTDLLEADELQALVDRTVGLAREAAGEAARGELRARPQTCGYRGSGCSYPTICRCGQR